MKFKVKDQKLLCQSSVESQSEFPKDTSVPRIFIFSLNHTLV